MLADLKYRLVKRLDEEALELASDPYGSECPPSTQKKRLRRSLNCIFRKSLAHRGTTQRFPEARETKAQKLLDGLGHRGARTQMRRSSCSRLISERLI